MPCRCWARCARSRIARAAIDSDGDRADVGEFGIVLTGIVSIVERQPNLAIILTQQNRAGCHLEQAPFEQLGTGTQDFQITLAGRLEQSRLVVSRQDRAAEAHGRLIRCRLAVGTRGHGKKSKK